MRITLRVVIGLVGILFSGLAIGFWLNPAGSAYHLGISALNALGVASLRADLPGFFGGAGLFALAAAFRNDARLLTAPLLLIAIALAGRLITVVINGFEPPMAAPIAIEAALVLAFLLGRQTLAVR